MAAQKQDDQLERTFSSYVRIQAVVLKTYLGRWTIERSGERGSGISVLPARYDDDDDKENCYCRKRLNYIEFLTIIKMSGLKLKIEIFGRSATANLVKKRINIYLYLLNYLWFEWIFIALDLAFLYFNPFIVWRIACDSLTRFRIIQKDKIWWKPVRKYFLLA